MPLQALKKKSYAAVVALLCAVALIFIGLSIFSIFRNRQSYLNEARIKSGAQAQLLTENTAGVIYAVDLLLLSIRSMVGAHKPDEARILSIPTAQFIEAELRFLPQIRDVVLLDSKGVAVYSSAGSEQFELAAFAQHRDAWLDFSVDAFIAAKGKAEIVLSRRLENQKNEFVGVLAAIVDSDFFYARFNEYLNINVDAIALVDREGSVLTNWFRDSDLEKKFIGANIQTLPHFSPFSETMLSGGRKTHESREAILSTHQLPGFPFQVAVLYGKKSVLQQWRREAGRDIAVIFFTTLIVVFTMTLAHRHRQRRQKAEQELRAHQARLEETVAERTAQLSEINRELIDKNETLEETLAEVKTLSGLLPICSHCKKIRDDKGYWNQIETYIRRHSGAEFSHGICPDCAKKHYPEFNLYDEDRV